MKIHGLLLLLGMAGTTAVAAPAGVRGWYELGATRIENAELEAFFDEPVAGNQVKFDAGFRGAIGLGADLHLPVLTVTNFLESAGTKASPVLTIPNN